MSKITELANRRDCMVRLKGCPLTTETTVAAHFRMAGICGYGQKPPDTIAAWACSYCHDRVDGRVKCDMTREQLQLAHLKGVARTLHAIDRMGYVLAKPE